jgi:DNA-binding MarR family transcriptional regulator
MTVLEADSFNLLAIGILYVAESSALVGYERTMSEAMSADTTDELFTTNPLTDLTGFQRDLLVAINGVEENGSPREGYNYEEPTGQCIRVQAELDGYDDINHGQLYPNLDTLKDKGLIEKVEVDRRTNGYKLSVRGKQALENYAEFVAGE